MTHQNSIISDTAQCDAHTTLHSTHSLFLTRCFSLTVSIVASLAGLSLSPFFALPHSTLSHSIVVSLPPTPPFSLLLATSAAALSLPDSTLRRALSLSHSLLYSPPLSPSLPLSLALSPLTRTLARSLSFVLFSLSPSLKSNSQLQVSLSLTHTRTFSPTLTIDDVPPARYPDYDSYDKRGRQHGDDPVDPGNRNLGEKQKTDTTIASHIDAFLLTEAHERRRDVCTSGHFAPHAQTMRVLREVGRLAASHACTAHEVDRLSPQQLLDRMKSGGKNAAFDALMVYGSSASSVV